MVGYLVGLLVLLLLVMAFVDRSSRRVLGLSALLVALTLVQVALVALRTSALFVSALRQRARASRLERAHCRDRRGLNPPPPGFL